MGALFTALMFVLAALLHGMSGIGFPLITTSVLSLSYSMRDAVLLTLLPTLLVNVISMAGGAYTVSHIVRAYGLLAVGSVAGSFVGVWLLLVIPSAPLQLMLAGVIALYLLLAARRRPWTLPQGKAAALGFGVAAGAIGGATNAMSPVLLMYLLAVSDDKDHIAQAANLCFCLGKLCQLVVLYPYLLRLKAADFVLMAVASCVAVLGLWMGLRLRRRVSVTAFRRIGLGILGILAVMLLGQGVG